MHLTRSLLGAICAMAVLTADASDGSASAEMSLWVSNHDQRPSRRVIHPIVGQTNYVYDAQGVLERIRGEAIAFCIKDCENVTIRNARIDWERSCLTEAKVVGFGEGTTRVAIDRSVFPYVVSDGRLLMTGPGWTNAVHKAKLYDGRTREHIPEVGDLPYDGAAREMPDGTVELLKDFSPFGTGLKEGDVIVFRPRLRDFPAIVVQNSRNVVLEDVIVHDAKGMGLVAQCSENVTWRGTRTARDRTSGVFPRPGAYASTHADASHFSNVKGAVTVENCWFDGMMDDAINVHSTCLAVTNVLGRRTLACHYAHAQAVGFDIFRAGDTLRFLRGSVMETGPEVKVAAVRRCGQRAVEITLAEDVPAGWGAGDAVEAADWQPTAVFRGNVVCRNRARGGCFTTPHPVLIESNLFDRVTGTALLFAGDGRSWFESGACRDVTIRGNVFSNCCTCARYHGHSHGVIAISPSVSDFANVRRGYHRNFRIERNDFLGLDAPLLFAEAADGIVFRDNRIRCNGRYRGHELPPYVLRSCRNVEVDGRAVPETTETAVAEREETLFNDGWEFRKEPDAAWRAVRIPHDWAIASPFDPKGEPGAGRLPYAGTGWYRRRFTLPAESAGQTVFLDVDGAMTESDVFLNGVRVGGRVFGFASYRVNLTPALRAPGEENTLEIRCHVPEKSARFYFGAGVYRSLHLIRTSPVHIGKGGVFVTTEVRPDGSAAVKATADVRQLPWTKAVVTHRILGEDGLVIREPKLWSPETPHLYALETVVSVDGRPVDRVLTRFGVRTLRFDPKKGFFLNGVHRQIKGVCLHHDLGSLGAAFDRGAFARQIAIMKEMGADAIRTTHNPPAPEVLDVCDEMGMMVMDEAFDCWNQHKTSTDYATHFDDWCVRDLIDFVERDRSHPSVIMWSIGNEIPGTLEPRADAMSAIGRSLTRVCHRADPTRLTTMGHCRSIAMTNGMETATDVFGANYLPWDYAWYLKNGKGRCGLIATETCSTVSRRGGSDSQFRKTNYPPDVEFRAQRENPACYGEFVWTGFDYLGEPAPWKDTSRSAYYGIVDLCGFPKDRYWIYRRQWRPEAPEPPAEPVGTVPAKLIVTTERYGELAFVKIKVVDADGRFVKAVPVRLRFAVTGEGFLEGVGNGDQTDFESLKGSTIRTFEGLAQAIVRVQGKAALSVSSEALACTVDVELRSGGTVGKM